MNYLNLSLIQKYDLFFTTMLFIFFFLTIKPLILTGEINSRNIIAFSLLFYCTLVTELLSAPTPLNI